MSTECGRSVPRTRVVLCGGHPARRYRRHRQREAATDRHALVLWGIDTSTFGCAEFAQQLLEVGCSPAISITPLRSARVRRSDGGAGFLTGGTRTSEGRVP